MEDWLLNGSYYGIALALVLTGCGLPLPEEVPIVAAGVLAANGKMVWYWALAACIFGAIAGDSAMYFLGRRFGRSLLKDHPWWVGFMTPQREERVEHMIRHHGIKVLFGARFLPGLRMPIYVASGILKMPYLRFFIADAIGATIVVGACFGLAYYFGPQIRQTIHDAERWLTITVVCVAVVLGLVYYFWRRKRLLAEAAKEFAAEEPAPPAAESPSDTHSGAA
jgi:membrane protein DedA with SNARE-associated domain